MLENLHICTANVKGLRDQQKRFRFYQWAKNQKAQIIFIQETHFDKNLEKTLNKEQDNRLKYFTSHGTSSSRGVAILIDEKLQYNLLDEYKDSEGRLILLNVEIHNIIYSLVNIYSPNNESDRNRFFKKVNEFINKNASGTVIIGGDMNDAISHLDRKTLNSRKKEIKPVNSFKTLLKSNNLIDIWRKLNPNKVQYTWRRNNFTQASRIDMFLINKDFAKNIKSCDIRPILIKNTDHQAVSLKIQNTSANSKGPGYWKINNSILFDVSYREIIRRLIKKYNKLIELNKMEIDLLWDALKLEIKNHSIQYCKNISNNRKREVEEMEKELKKITEEFENNNNANELIEKISYLENKIEQAYAYKARGAQIRSKQQWIEKGEKNNKYFLGLEKSRQNKKVILKLKDDNGNIVSNQSEILKIERSFYAKLYAEENNKSPDEMVEYISNTNTKHKLTKDESRNCDGYITLEELTSAVNNIKPNKSPGMDGLSANFYKTFWNELGPMLLKVFNTSYDKQKLPFSQRQSILSLLYKKNDPLDLSNYRPISLLNTDYKILSHTLASRIKTVIDKIISSDQSGYIKNRYIGFNLRQIQDIIDYADRFSVEGVILFIDFSKAFDTLNWKFMYQTLAYFGFNDNFINWIKTLYSDINTSVTNNGWISAPVKPQRGIRQGCPCSSILFVIAVEIMANKIRENPNIKGIEIKLDGKTHSLKISQLADDTTLFLKSKEEILSALNIIEIFGSFSGLKLNKNKTEGIWIGKLKHSKDKISNINFVDKPVKVLGLYVGNNKKECDKLNWDSKLNKAKNLMISWEKRNLTIFGKILIIKALIIPQFTYIASTTVLNKDYITAIEKEIYKFIWNGKVDKVKRNTLIAKYDKGGLKMLDIKSYFYTLKIKWIRRLFEASTENWTLLPKFYLNKYGKNFLIFKMDLGIEYTRSMGFEQQLPDFYLQILKIWIQFRGVETEMPKNYLNIRKQIIWGNKKILFKKKPLMMINWIKCDLIYINDILDENGNITENFILSKLKLKQNWISELAILRQAIPKEWINILRTESSIKSKVNINSSIIRIQKSNIKIENLDNKTVYDFLIKDKIKLNIGIETWKKQISIEPLQIKNTFDFIHNRINSNKLKSFKWKLISRILPNQQNLYVWKISDTPMCQVCRSIDTYQHFFIDCKFISSFWKNVYDILNKIHFDNKIELKHLAFGYKITDKGYWDFNLILTIIGFVIYKTFYVSEKRTKSVDIFNIFKNECLIYFDLIEKERNMKSALIDNFKQFLK